MAMNSQGNEAPQSPLDHESINRRFDEQRLIPNIDVTITPTDVLCGRGKSSFTHAGNRKFRDAITSSIDAYQAAASRLDKSKVVQRIVEDIKQTGGRFLKRDRASGGWVELDTKSARDKVGHAIRDAASLIEQRKQKQQRRKDAFAQLEHKGRSASPTSSSVSRRAHATTGLLREESRLSISTSLREPVERTYTSWANFEESKLSSREADDDDIYYETASQTKLEDLEDDTASEDSFVKFINDVLGPLPPREIRFDPLHDVGNSAWFS